MSGCCSNSPFCKCAVKVKTHPPTPPCEGFNPSCGCSMQPNQACPDQVELTCLQNQITALEHRDNELASRILDQGLTIEFRVSAGNFEWRYVGDVSWTLITTTDNLGLQDVIRYGVAQALSDVQQAQAVANLGITVVDGMATIKLPGGNYTWPVFPA